MGVFVPLLVQPARQCPCNGSSISGTVSARAMGATPSSIIVADMQAMTARDSFVMTNHPPQRDCRSHHEHRFYSTTPPTAVFWTNLTCGKKQRCDLRVSQPSAQTSQPTGQQCSSPEAAWARSIRRSPAFGSNEQIFGVNGQILGPDQSD